MDDDLHRTDAPDGGDDRHGESRADTQTATPGREHAISIRRCAEKSSGKNVLIPAVSGPSLSAEAGPPAVLLVVGGVLYWLNARHYATTTDAQIDGNVSQMASQVAGRVTGLLVGDNQHVVAGQRLLEIDLRDYQAKLDQALGQQASAAAQVQQATAQLGVQQANLDQAQANVVVAQADLTQAQQDHDRLHRVSCGSHLEAAA